MITIQIDAQGFTDHGYTVAVEAIAQQETALNPTRAALGRGEVALGNLTTDDWTERGLLPLALEVPAVR